jgi:hypothetical protein
MNRPRWLSGGPDEPLGRFVVRAAVFVLIVLVLLTAVVLTGMKTVNTRLDLGETTVDGETGTTGMTDPDSLWIPDITSTHVTEVVLIEGPESGWPVTPCSLFVSDGSAAVHDSLPEARTTAGIPYETLLVVRRWAELSGMTEADLDRVYVFNRLDSLYVDLPAALDVGGLKRTIEGRFICYTRLFPLVGGNLLSGYEDGLRLSGVPGVFDRP